LESGHFEVDIRSVDLQSVLDSVVHSISNKVADKNVKVRTSYCGTLPRQINTDSRRLQQILYNLLGNAGKFSREGTNIDFSVRLVQSSEQNRIEFVVKDYGKGIEKKDVECIFQPFSQASKETQTVYGGTGLGLSITRKLVSKLGGTISVDSVPGKFAKFCVNLPYDGEFIDSSFYKEKLSDVTIVLLDSEERLTDPFSKEDESMPLCPSFVQEVGIDVMRCSSWKELEEKLYTDDDDRCHYALLVEKTMEDAVAVDRIHEKVGKTKCSWFTFGPTADRTARHFKSLSGIFPSILLEDISKEVIKDLQGGEVVKSSDESLSDNRTVDDDCQTDFQCRRSVADGRPSEHVDGMKPVEEERPASFSSPSHLAKTTSTPKVLYAEDNIVNQKVLGKIFERLGVEDVTIVDNGLKAVELCESNKYDYIFMDMDMPVMDGLEACRIIMERNPSERVVFLTAHALDTFKEKADAAGAVDFISKPFNMQKIRSILTELG
jgi:two-component system sensor histidine kinase BarA